MSSAIKLIALLHRGIIGSLKCLPATTGAWLVMKYNFILAHNFLARPGRPTGRLYKAPTYFGATMECSTGDFIQMRILHFGVWEPDVSHVIARMLRPGDTFVDVGANIGYHTLLASKAVGPGGSVVAIEALPATYQTLSRHVRANEAGNVRCANVAVAAEPGQLTLYMVEKHNVGAASTLASRGAYAEATVDALPLDQILTEQERSRVRLIKMDIEGAEPPVLRRLLDTLDLYPRDMAVIVELAPEDDPAASRELYDRLRSAEFDAFAVENSYRLEWYLKWRTPTPLRKLDDMPEEQTDILFNCGMPFEET